MPPTCSWASLLNAPLRGLCNKNKGTKKRAAGADLSRPGVEPVKADAVDKGRELPSADAELVSHRAEAQDHMQIAPHLQPHQSISPFAVNVSIGKSFSVHGSFCVSCAGMAWHFESL